MTCVAAGGLWDASPQQLLILGLLLVLFVFIGWTTRRRGKEPSPRQYRREIDSATRQQEQVRLELEELLRELEAAGQRLGDQLERQAGRIETLLKESDRRINALSAALDRAKTTDSPGATSSDASPLTNAHSTTNAESPEVGATEVQPEADVPPHDRADAARRRIYELADAGVPALDISKQTDRPVGEIELILNLRPR